MKKYELTQYEFVKVRVDHKPNSAWLKNEASHEKNLCFARKQKRKSCYCESDQRLCSRYIDTRTNNPISS